MISKPRWTSIIDLILEEAKEKKKIVSLNTTGIEKPPQDPDAIDKNQVSILDSGIKNQLDETTTLYNPAFQSPIYKDVQTPIFQKINRDLELIEMDNENQNIQNVRAMFGNQIDSF